MEQRMYHNAYIKKADKAPSYDDPDLTDAEKVPLSLSSKYCCLYDCTMHQDALCLVNRPPVQRIKDTFRKKPGDPQMKLGYKTHRQDIAWVYKQQFAKASDAWN